MGTLEHAGRPSSAVIVLVVACVACCCAEDMGYGHRAFMATLDGVKLGSSIRNTKSMVTMPVQKLPAKTTVLVPLRLLNSDLLTELTSARPEFEAAVVVLPRANSKGNMTAEELQHLQSLETLLTSNLLQQPLVFMVENDRLQSLMSELQPEADAGRVPSPQSGGFEVTLHSEDRGTIKRHPVVNFACALNAAQVASGHAPHAHTVLVTAHYDSFSVAPGLPSGADSNGSGVAVLLQLLRTFHRLFSGGARGRYNVMFLLTGGGHLNFEGSHQWLNDADASLLERMNFVLCLDTLGSTAASGKLYLHYSKPPKDDAVATWYQMLGAGAAAAGLELRQVHRKINIATTQLSWPHEQFSRRRILAATLSALSQPPASLRRSSLADTAPPAPTSLAVATQAVANFLVTAIYPNSPPSMTLPLASPPDAITTLFLQHWAEILASTSPRAAHFYPGVSPLNAAFLTYFKEHSDVASQHVWMTPATMEFANVTTPVVVSITRQHSLVVDCVVALSTLLYLGVLFVALLVLTHGWSNVMGPGTLNKSAKHRVD